MAKRGPYGKGIERREQILAAALRTIAERGFLATSVAELAEAAGLSQSGLLHYFGSKEDLFVAVLRKRDEADIETLDALTPEDLIQVIHRNTRVPGLIELFTHMQAAAADPRHPAHDYMRIRYDRGTAAFTATLRRQQEAGLLPAHLDPAAVAAIFFALADGLQSRWLIDRDFDMVAHLESAWRSMIREP
ncbi:TetR/AcrR family transcriptional regulator [Nocardia sp. NPDC055321]